MAQLSFDVDVSWLPGGHPSSSRKHGKLNEIESCGPFLMHTGCSQVAIAVPKISCFVSSPRFGYRVFMGFPMGCPIFIGFRTISYRFSNVHSFSHVFSEGFHSFSELFPGLHRFSQVWAQGFQRFSYRFSFKLFEIFSFPSHPSSPGGHRWRWPMRLGPGCTAAADVAALCGAGPAPAAWGQLAQPWLDGEVTKGHRVI